MKVESAGYHFIHNGNPFIIHRTGLANHIILLFHTPVSISINGQPSVEYNGSCAVILKKETPRRYSNLNGIPLKNDWIQFSSSVNIDISDYGIEADTVYSHIPPEYMKKFSRIVSNIVQERLEEKYNSSEISDLYLKIFLSTLGQCVNSVSKYNINHPLFQSMYEARTHLLRNFQSSPNIESQAKSIGLSEYYFRKLYKKIFDSTPQSDIIEARINHACWLLSNTDDTIYVISEECGYHSNEHFMRQFKQTLGITPSDFRKNLSKEIPEEESNASLD